MTCPSCQNSDETMMELVTKMGANSIYLCNVCSKTFAVVIKAK